MNSSKSLRAFVFLAIAASPALAAAQAHHAAHLTVTAQLAGQFLKGKSKAPAERQQVASILTRARQAIKESDFETADSLISAAEKMNPEYNLLHMGDTPKKARADLNAKRAKAKGAQLKKPSEKFKPDVPADKTAQPQAEPIAQTGGAGRLPEVRDPDGEAPLTLPDGGGKFKNSPVTQRGPASYEEEFGNSPAVPRPVQEQLVPNPTTGASNPAPGGAATPRPVAAGGQAAAPGNSDPRVHSDRQLLLARRALAVGDVRQASASVEAARKLGIPYGFHDDTPDKVDNAIRTYRQVTENSSGRQDEAARHQLADLLMDQAQELMKWRDYDEAERLVHHVKGLRVNYGPFEAKPDTLLEKIVAARRQGGARTAPAQTAARAGEPVRGGANPANVPRTNTGVRPAVAHSDAHPHDHDHDHAPAGAARPSNNQVARAGYNSQQDSTRNRATAGQDELPAAEDSAEAAPSQETPSDNSNAGEEEPPAPEPIEQAPLAVSKTPQAEPSGTSAGELLDSGDEALKQQDTKRAQELFRRAYELRDQLDEAASQRLQDRMQRMAAPPLSPTGPRPESLLNKLSGEQQKLIKQVSAEVSQREIASGKVREKDPKKAVELLREARTIVETAGLDSESRSTLIRRIERKMHDLDHYIADNKAQIELDASNKEILKDVERRLKGKVESDNKLAKLVDDFNKYMDEQRYAEAEVLAKRARELDPENPIVKQLIWQSRFVQRSQRNQNLIENKDKWIWEALNNVDEAAVPIDDNDPYQIGDVKKWKDLTERRRAKQLAESRSRRSERELEIERKLKTPVAVKFRNRPLIEVIQQLEKLAGINIHLDEKGLDEEGITPDEPVTIELAQEISLKSALNLILEPKHLSYVIKDEVLKITSEQLRDGHVYPVTYSVADLVIPIPNFVPHGRMGLAGALSDAYGVAGGGMMGMGGGPGTAYLASQDGTPASGIVNPAVLAQMNQLMPGSGSRAAGPGQNVPFGPGGMAGGAQADFESLIELITTTVKPQTWDEVGGPGSISDFRNNLSLVISQTQDVHEEIVDLLEQLRRNQDLQVTIEVRFITLNDNFFERIGVDFQFNITTTPTQDPRGLGNKKEIVGLEPPGPSPFGFPNYPADFAIPFRQSSFNLATPQFGQPVEVARFGFAILSDLEAFLLVNAAQGDRRSNVLQAPKVTLFNGQFASVSDQTQTPFVISVIPVVGDFAAGYQPVITVLSEGTFLSVQATVSNDRRFVRLTVLPMFSQIGDVKEFTFSGSKTTTKKTTANDTKGAGDTTAEASSDDSTTSTDGITIQLPNFSFVTVNTTVSVPDGGTVLLGGIKRLSEGRNEFGVPILSKLPYINRLFKNVGIGRETQSLMMMVTPRIIIQEEEEERLGLPPAP